MKKYFVKDEEGKLVEITEVCEGEELPKAEAPKKDEEGAAAAPFTPEQMDAIRKIISEELAKAKEQAHAPEEAHDAEEMKKEEEEKKLEEEKKAADSKKTADSASPVSLENKTVQDSNSSVDFDEERNNAFLKRYGLSK